VAAPSIIVPSWEEGIILEFFITYLEKKTNGLCRWFFIELLIT
jgi:hypothetical protein